MTLRKRLAKTSQEFLNAKSVWDRKSVQQMSLLGVEACDGVMPVMYCLVFGGILGKRVLQYYTE